MKKLILVAALIVGLSSAGNIYAQGFGPGYGGGMMGRGMMGGGMMGGYGWQGAHQVNYPFVKNLLSQTAASAYVNKEDKTVTFTGNRVDIAMAAVQPDFPDTTFEVAGLVNPTIVVSAGSLVTLHFVNMDYGRGMTHGVVITPIPPPLYVSSKANQSKDF